MKISKKNRYKIKINGKTYYMCQEEWDVLKAREKALEDSFKGALIGPKSFGEFDITNGKLIEYGKKE